MSPPCLVVLSGPTAVGKSTLRQRILEDQRFAFSVSATTRPPRPGEVDGRDYHFLDTAEFTRRLQAGEFLEHAQVHGNRYGTLRPAIDRTVAQGRIPILEIDVQGAASIRDSGQRAVFVFVMPPSMEALRQRITSRNTEDPATVERRLARAEAEVREAPLYDLQAVNDDLERCLGEIREFLEQRFEG